MGPHRKGPEIIESIRTVVVVVVVMVQSAYMYSVCERLIRGSTWHGRQRVAMASWEKWSNGIKTCLKHDSCL
jgi:hypothetical protein